MKEAKVYKDGFRAVFTDQDDFMDCIKSINRNSSWERTKSRLLRLVPITSESRIATEMEDEYKENGLDPDILMDTIASTGLLLKSRGKHYPVRACAIKSILDRAGISGNGLRRVEKNVYARILNDCLKVSRGEALLRVSEGKVSAVLGGDSHDYAVLDMEQIFSHAIEFLQENFRGCTYLGGFYEHDMVSALWELSGESNMLETYEKEIYASGSSPREMKPMIRISTSDTGSGGANIYPMLVSEDGNLTINLGTPLRLGHRNGTQIREFDSQLSMIFAKYQQGLKQLQSLLNVSIMNPVNCMKGVLDRLGIPRKYAAEAVELFCCQYGEEPCTAHEIYYGISEIPYMMACNGEDGSRMAKMEEVLARAMKLDWEEYDFPGKYKW